MPLTLILTRHAKSAWDDPELDDFERPLDGRGRAAALNIGTWLITQGYLPDTVLVSGARRTVETWSRMAGIMPSTATMESVPALYLASADIILNVLRARRSPVIMLIAHNPGIGDFAAGTVTGVNVPLSMEFDEGIAIEGNALRLGQHGLSPIETEPGEIVLKGLHEFRTAAVGIEIIVA